MAILLAIDTSTDACSVALLSATGIYQESIVMPREHTQRLLPLVDRILSRHDMLPTQLDAIAFGCGPGSFTGLRICTSVVQGLAYAVDRPVIPVSTLKAMAQAAIREQIAGAADMIMPALDARMQEVYWGLFQRAETGKLLTVAKEQVTSLAAIDLAPFSPISLCALGSGWYDDDLQKLQPTTCLAESYPQAYDIAELGLIAFDEGEVVSPFMATPVYLRNAAK